MVFQDPYASLNPRQTVRRTLADPLRLHGVTNRGEIEDRVADMLRRVGLTADQADRYPHEFSGGQRQRIGIARALILRPAWRPTRSRARSRARSLRRADARFIRAVPSWSISAAWRPGRNWATSIRNRFSLLQSSRSIAVRIRPVSDPGTAC